MNTRPNSAREVLRASHRSITDANARAAASIIPMLNYGGCRAEIDGDDVVFSGPTGRHALALSVSNAERVLAHWDGFVSPRGAYLRWASVRPLTADERSRPCADCGGELEAHGVATAFGIFCRGECAEGHRRKTGRGDGTAPAKRGLTVREAQARIANTGAAFRRSGKRLVGVWSRCTEPVATTDARSPIGEAWRMASERWGILMELSRCGAVGLRVYDLHAPVVAVLFGTIGRYVWPWPAG